MTEGPCGEMFAGAVPAHTPPTTPESGSQTRDLAPRLEIIVGCAILAVIVGDSASAHSFVANAQLHWFGLTLPLGSLLTHLDVGIDVALAALAFRWYLPFARVVRTRCEPIETVRWWWRVGLATFPAYWAAMAIVVAVSSQRLLEGTERRLAHLASIQGYVPARWNRGLDGLHGGELIGVLVAIAVIVPAFAASVRRVSQHRDPFAVQVIGVACLASFGVVLVGIVEARHLWAPFRVVAPYLTTAAVGIGIAAMHDHFYSSTSHAVVIGARSRRSSRPNKSRRVTTAVRSLGMVAYGAYLWHWFVIDTIGTRFGSNSWFAFAFTTIVSIVASALCGAATLFLIERPVARRLAHRESRGWVHARAVGQRVVGVRVERRFVRGLAAITVMSFIWRVMYVVTHVGRVKLAGDAFYYHWQANDLAHGRWFIDPVQLRFYGRITPSAFHPPAYVSYLAAVSRFIGQTELTHRLASTVLGAVTVFAIGLCARQLFRCDAAGWLAAAFAGVYAHLWINDEMLMSESMAQLWTIVMLLAVFRFWRQPRAKTAALMGAAIACAALSRAEASTLFVLLVIPLALGARALAIKRRSALVVVAWGVGALIMAPWLLFNLVRFEHPVTLSNGIGSVLMVSNCDTTYGNNQRGNPDPNAYLGYWSINCVNEFKIPRLLHGDESEKEVVWRKAGLDYLSSHTSQVPKMAVLRAARMWDVGFLAQNVHPFNAFAESRGDWQSTLATLQYVVLAPLAIGGLVVLRRRRVTILPFLAIAGTITITAAATFGITRYRAPVDAFLPILAAGFITTRLSKPTVESG